jgi:murein L,D-transpeptidase YafK
MSHPKTIVRLALSALILLGAIIVNGDTSVLPGSGKFHITVMKGKRELLLHSGGKLVGKYPIGLGTNPNGPKTVAGDRRTPEGEYYVCVKNPKSAYYLSLGLSYPNGQDAKAALNTDRISKSVYESIASAIKKGRTPPWHTALGGEIFIHGRGSQSDWTWGCIALNDDDMLELYKAVPIGTPVTILQ